MGYRLVNKTRFVLSITTFIIVLYIIILFGNMLYKQYVDRKIGEVIATQSTKEEQIKMQNNINELKEKLDGFDKELKEINAIISTMKEKAESSKASRGTLMRREINATVTAYCACIKCCGKTDGITKSGVQALANKTIAMDAKYPMGTLVVIEGFDGIIFEVQDRGGAIKGNKIDIYMNTHQEALNFGIQNRKVQIIRYGYGEHNAPELN